MLSVMVSIHGVEKNGDQLVKALHTLTFENLSDVEAWIAKAPVIQKEKIGPDIYVDVPNKLKNWREE